jgi:hypothetical protein
MATVSIDGREVPTESNVTLDPGGVTREEKMAGKRVYFSETTVPPILELNVLHTEDTDLIELGNITDATVLVEFDNGQDYMLSGAFSATNRKLSAGDGTIPLTLKARRCERV